MEKIKGFHISSMTVSGFKCYEEPTEITFGNPTIVTGGNGRGKSSLADAIAFAVTGLPFFGERGIDRLHNETNPDLQITMRFTDETGKAHELTRSRQKDRMSITYDGYAIRQTDLNEMFGERDVFLSIFNPLYFIEELGEDGKKLLERYLPPIPQADVLAQLNAQTQQRLSGVQLPSPETFLKNRREEIRELEQNAVYLSGKLDLAQKQRQSSKELSNRLTAQIQELQREIASLEARRFENVNLEELQEQLVQASEQYEELSGEAPETPDTAELDAKLQEFHAKLGARSSEVYQPKYTDPLAEDTAKVQALGKKYQQNAALLKRFQPGTSCPVCRRVLSQQEYPAFRQALQAETERIAADGTQLKGQITELQELEQKSQSAFEQFKADDLAKYQAEIDALNQKREQLQTAAAQQNMQRQQTLEQLRTRIQNLSASMECGTLSPADSERLAECKASLKDCRVQLAAAQQAQVQEQQNQYEALMEQGTQLCETDPEQALGCFEQAQALYPEESAPYISYAYALYCAQDYERCISYIEDELGLGKAYDIEAQSQLSEILGAAYFECDDYAAAASFFRLSTAGGDITVNAQRDYAVSLGRLGDIDAADEILSQMYAAGASGDVTDYVQAEIDYAKKEYLDAESGFQAVLNQTQDIALQKRALRSLAEVYRDCAALVRTGSSPIGNPATKAVEVLANGIETYGLRYDSTIWEMLALAYFEAYHTDPSVPQSYLRKAGECFNRVLELGVTKSYLYSNLYTIYYELQEYDLAEQTLDAYAAQYPKDYEPYAFRAMLYITLENRKEQSARDYSVAVEAYETAGQLLRSDDDATYYQQLQSLIQQLQKEGWING